MDSISPDIAKKLLHRDLANLAQRVQRGGNLSRSERVMIQSMAVSTGQVPAVAADNSDLARILGVSRSSINRWRKLKDAPKPDASGFHDVTQWREFMRRHELQGDPAVTDEETVLRARKVGGAGAAPGGEEGRLRGHRGGQNPSQILVLQ